MLNKLLEILPIAASTFGAGALLAWYLASRPKGTDSATEGRWQLEVAALREEAEKNGADARTWEERAHFQAGQLRKAMEHLRSLEEQVASYLRQYAQVKDALKKEILQKSSLKAELAASLAQIEALQGRVGELEMERTGTLTSLRRTLSA